MREINQKDAQFNIETNNKKRTPVAVLLSYISCLTYVTAHEQQNYVQVKERMKSLYEAELFEDLCQLIYQMVPDIK